MALGAQSVPSPPPSVPRGAPIILMPIKVNAQVHGLRGCPWRAEGTQTKEDRSLASSAPKRAGRAAGRGCARGRGCVCGGRGLLPKAARTHLGKPGVRCRKERPAGRTAWGGLRGAGPSPLLEAPRDVGARGGSHEEERGQGLGRQSSETRGGTWRLSPGTLRTQKRSHTPKPSE